MPPVILGPLHLRWCGPCNLPLLAVKRCPGCGGATTPVRHTPPGDIRPAFEADLHRVRDTADRQFGDGCGASLLPDGVVAILNRCPAVDRMDEVIVDGTVIGVLRYDLTKGYVFMPRPAGAARFASLILRGFVVADAGAVGPVLAGSNLMGPGVVEANRSIRTGDEVVVLDAGRNPIGVGSARMDGAALAARQRGMAVKVRWAERHSPPAPAGKRTWDDVVKANLPHIGRRVERAGGFIRRLVAEAERDGLGVAVSYSGGKDSLATLHLALDAGLRPKLMFVDTGLELPETVANVQETAARHGLDLLVESAGGEFWRSIGRFGPPGRDFRWCCKSVKLGPAVRLIRKNFPGGVLTFIGQRAYESEGRAAHGAVWTNPWVPGQRAASPIQNWTALHVWLYLMSKGVAANPWYFRGLDRLGCYLCPASNMADMETVKEGFPGFSRWEEYLRGYSSENGLPEAWHEAGLWRWKRLPAGVAQEFGDSFRTLQSPFPTPQSGRLTFAAAPGYRPCTGGVSIEGAFGRPLDMERVVNLLNAVGRPEAVQNAPGDGGAYVGKWLDVYTAGAVVVRASAPEEADRRMEVVRRIVVQAHECIGCGICLGRCRHDALSLDEKKIIVIDAGKCRHCWECQDGPCPVIAFGEERGGDLFQMPGGGD